MLFFKISSIDQYTKNIVPGAGIEPARPYGHMALNHACLPVPAPGQKEQMTPQR